jgi:hypothetical protein
VLGYNLGTVTSGTDIADKNFWNFEWSTISGYKYEYVDGFCDDFDDGNADGWTEINYDPSRGTGEADFTVENGEYSLDSRAGGWVAIANRGDSQWNNYAISVKVKKIEGSYWPDVFFRYQDLDNFYFVQLRSNELRLRKRVVGGYSGIGSWSGTTNVYEWHTIKVVVNGDSIKVYLDGELRIDATDSSLTEGVAGLGAYNSHCHFDDVCVMDISEPIDGWSMHLYKDGDYVTPYETATTSGGGMYSFTVKDHGDYEIMEELPSGWTEICPEYIYGSDHYELGYSFTAESGRDVPCRDFWNFEWLTVSGHKFFDADGNGVLDIGEPGLEHWRINLDKDSSLYAPDEFTDGLGYYEFTVKDPGTYTIYESLLASWWTQTAPTPTEYEFDVESGEDVEVDFGNWLDSPSIVTDSSYIPFDIEPNGDRQFKLIFTRDPQNRDILIKRLTASNPGQFMYNIFYAGDISGLFTITLPYPFVTQGAMPIHVYEGLNTDPDGYLIPGNDITDQFSITPTPNGVIYLENYADGTIDITLNPETYSGDFVWITVHVDYGLKKVGDYRQVIYDAIKIVEPAHNILDNSAYQFMVAGPFGDSDSIYNLNVFKNDPGFLIMVQDSSDTPVEGVIVTIDDLDVEGFTDEDGCFFYEYKHKGKGYYFLIKLPDYDLDELVFLRANKFAIVPFIVP